MNAQTKKVIIIGSLLLVFGGIGYFLWRKNKKKNELKSSGTDDKTKVLDTSATTQTDTVPTETIPTQTNTDGTNPPKSVNNGSKPPIIDLVLSNLGASAKKVKDTIMAGFNSNKNFAVFYNNGRVFIFDTATKKTVKSGSYSNGGKTIKLDSGKTISSNSVWQNILNTLK